MLDLYIIM